MSGVGSVPFAVTTGVIGAGIGGVLYGGFAGIDDRSNSSNTLPKVLGMGVGAGVALTAVGTNLHSIATGDFGFFPLAKHSAGVRALGIGALLLGGAAAAYVGVRMADGSWD